MKKYLNSYPITDISIQIGNREIELTIVDDPDRFLDKLSREDCDGRLYLPYWTYLWESAIGLAHYVSELGNTFAGQQILEIGCGYGLSGIVACKEDGEWFFQILNMMHFYSLNTMHSKMESVLQLMFRWIGTHRAFNANLMSYSPLM